MSGIKDMPGRRIGLVTIIDRGAGRVKIIRNLRDGQKGFVVDSGAMGWMPIEDYREFLRSESLRVSEKVPTLMELFRLNQQ